MAKPLQQVEQLSSLVISMYKNTFKMVCGDIVVDGDLILVDGQEELRQNIENRLSVNVGEWFLNIGMGLDYAAISGKGIEDRGIEFALRECCFQDGRVKEVRDVRVKRNPETREALIEFVIIDKEDNPLYMEEVVNLG